MPPRRPNVRHVYHLYMLFAEQRDALYQYCLDHGVEAKIHYPIPLYQQEGLKHLGYPAGHVSRSPTAMPAKSSVSRSTSI